jgi:hypothetical protein
MVLRYSDKPQIRSGGQQTTDVWSRFPANVKHMASAPSMGSQPIRLFEPDGKARWGIHHLGAWREVERVRDFYTGSYSVRMNGALISNPVCWNSS